MNRGQHERRIWTFDSDRFEDPSLRIRAGQASAGCVTITMLCQQIHATLSKNRHPAVKEIWLTKFIRFHFTEKEMTLLGRKLQPWVGNVRELYLCGCYHHDSSGWNDHETSVLLQEMKLDRQQQLQHFCISVQGGVLLVMHYVQAFLSQSDCYVEFHPCGNWCSIALNSAVMSVDLLGISSPALPISFSVFVFTIVPSLPWMTIWWLLLAFGRIRSHRKNVGFVTVRRRMATPLFITWMTRTTFQSSTLFFMKSGSVHKHKTYMPMSYFIDLPGNI